MSFTRIAVFLSVVLLLDVGLHYYVWARLVRDTSLPEPWRRAATLALAFMAVLLVASLVLRRVSTAAWVDWVTAIGLTWGGVLFLLFSATLVGDLVKLALGAAQRTAFAADPARREFLTRTVAAVAAVGAGGISLWGIGSAVSKTAVKRVSVALDKLSAALDGYTIVQFSDVHVGSATIGKEFMRDLVARTNALEPDMVVITGDLVDGSTEELGDAVRELGKLRTKDGVFFVTGNHEYYSGANEWIGLLSSIGVRVLRNERVRIRGEEGFDLGGVDDWTASQFYSDHGHDLARVVEGRDATKALVLLAHQPKAIGEAAERGVDLQLSGHTHGGQIFPFNFLVKLQQPFVAGLDRLGATQIYVSRGTGYWGPPMRVGAPAEITHIELTSARA